MEHCSRPGQWAGFVIGSHGRTEPGLLPAPWGIRCRTWRKNDVVDEDRVEQSITCEPLWLSVKCALIPGYLGGVSWAILVAKVCTIYPKAGAARIINKFFLVMSQWRWPEPVMLLPEGYGASPHLWSITQMPWDIMPIITPVYPQQNSR